MTHVLKPYPAYRDSGSPWLGEVPEHWEVRRNGRLFIQRNETEYADLPILEVSLRTGVRVRQFDKGDRKQKMTDRSQYKRAAQGDIAYNMMRMWQGAVGVAPMDGLVSPAYVVACPFPGIDSRYYSYLFRTGDYMSEIDNLSRGIVSDRNRLYWDDFKQLPAVFPPFNEQVKIADFLDGHQCLANRLVRNKERLIALLKERKQAIIDCAVTRGLDPNAPMKPTGMNWMPEAPAHWRTRRLKACATNVIDMTGGREPGDVYIALEHVESWTGKIVDVDFDTAFESQVKRFRTDDVLFGKLRPYLAKSARPSRGGVCVGEFLVLRSSNDDLLSGYLEMLLRSKSVVDAIDASTFGAKMPRADWQFIGNMRFPLPPVSEQAAIVERLERSAAAIDAALARARRQIGLLREYRERLINDVVTGKLDVREARVAASPDADAPQEWGQAPSHRAEAGAPAIP